MITDEEMKRIQEYVRNDQQALWDCMTNTMFLCDKEALNKAYEEYKQRVAEHLSE